MHSTIANTASTTENTEIDSTDKHLIDKTKNIIVLSSHSGVLILKGRIVV
jgi:hypothetical protein